MVVQDVTPPEEPPTLHEMAYVEATRRARTRAICKNFISDVCTKRMRAAAL